MQHIGLNSSKTIEASEDVTSASKALLDGGASHDVYHSRTVPEGSVEKDVELAHGSRQGYVKGDVITFIEKEATEEEEEIPKILSLGRMIKHGAKLHWNDQKAVLSLPNGQQHAMDVVNDCPYVNLETVKAIRKWKTGLEEERIWKHRAVEAYRALRLKLRTQKRIR